MQSALHFLSVSAAATTALAVLRQIARSEDSRESESTEAESVFSAPGKAILFGEHAVVFGRPAIAVALDLRTSVRVRRRFLANPQKGLPERPVRLVLDDLGFIISCDLAELSFELVPSSGEFLGRCRRALAEGKCVDPTESIPEGFLSALRDEARKYYHCRQQISQNGDGLGNSEDPSPSILMGIAAFFFLFLVVVGDEAKYLPPEQLSVRVQSRLPVGMGLGSSAAYSVSLVAAMLHSFGVHTSCSCSGRVVETGEKEASNRSVAVHPLEWLCADQRHLVNSWAFQLERIIHGTPSGIDNTVSSFGGVVFFSKSQRRSMETRAKLRLLLVNTRVPRSTSALVAGVRRRYDAEPAAVEGILDEIAAIATRGGEIFEEACDTRDVPFAELGTLVDRNQELLALLGVNHASLEAVTETAKRCGFNAKLSGAGGGGCALVLVKPGQDISVVESELRALGCDVFEVAIGGEGVAFSSFSQDEEPTS